jgi:hypothetical protein
MLTHSQIEGYKNDGFFFVDEPILPVEDILEVRCTLDALFEGWDQLPRIWAPGAGAGGPPAVAEILNTTMLAPQLMKTQLMAECRRMAAQILGVERTWCHFDHMIYKLPGTSHVSWHQDIAFSKTRLLARSVHFWIPLHDLMPDDGCMMFVPESHLGELRPHTPNVRPGGAMVREVDLPSGSSYVTKTLPMGGFSIHTPRTLHASAANGGTTLRKAWILQIGSGPASAARQSARGCIRMWTMAQTGRHRRGSTT